MILMMSLDMVIDTSYGGLCLFVCLLSFVQIDDMSCWFIRLHRSTVDDT